MTMPFYVAPEQVMKDRAEYAQKGIARGRALVATIYDAGVLIVAENPSRTLHKISEIYDRVAFAGVGKYNEFDQLRVAGVRHADTKGFAYSREDVDARSLANLYAQYLGQVFTHEMKPLEVEILVAELDATGVAHQLYHIAYDGTVVDETGFSVLGGDAATITDRLAASYDKGWTLEEALRQCVAALAGPERTLGPAELEVAVLTAGSDRTVVSPPRRTASSRRCSPARGLTARRRRSRRRQPGGTARAGAGARPTPRLARQPATRGRPTPSRRPSRARRSSGPRQASWRRHPQSASVGGGHEGDDDQGDHDHHDEGGRSAVDTGPAAGRPRQAARGRGLPRRRVDEGILDLVGEQDLSCQLELLGGHEDLDSALERVRPVAHAFEDDDDALGPEAGGEHAAMEGAR